MIYNYDYYMYCNKRLNQVITYDNNLQSFHFLFSCHSSSPLSCHSLGNPAARTTLLQTFFDFKRHPVQRVNRRDNPLRAWLQRVQFPNELLFWRRRFQGFIRFLDGFLGDDDLLDVGFKSNSLYLVSTNFNCRQGLVTQITASSALIAIIDRRGVRNYLIL
jgi:hypothetical protein